MRGLRSLLTKHKPKPPTMLEAQGGCVWRQCPSLGSSSGSWWGLWGFQNRPCMGIRADGPLCSVCQMVEETCCLCTLVRGCLLVTAKFKMTFYSFLSCESQELGGSDGVCHTCNQGQDSDHLGSWFRVPWAANLPTARAWEGQSKHLGIREVSSHRPGTNHPKSFLDRAFNREKANSWIQPFPPPAKSQVITIVHESSEMLTWLPSLNSGRQNYQNMKMCSGGRMRTLSALPSQAVFALHCPGAVPSRLGHLAEWKYSTTTYGLGGVGV